MNVLVADDQRLSRAGIVKMIEWERLGLRLAGECANGREALEMIGDVEADIVITDVRMPVLGGLELIEKAKELYTGLSFIVISGYDQFDYVRKSVQLTVADYLLKPVDPVELNRLLARLIRESAETRRKEAYELQKRREQFFYFLLEGAYDDPAVMRNDFADLRFAEADDRYVAAVFESDLDKTGVCETFRGLAERRPVCILRTRGVYLLIAAGRNLTAEALADEIAGVAQGGAPLHAISLGPAAENIGRLREAIGQAFDAYAVRSGQPGADDREPFLYDRMERGDARIVPVNAVLEQDWLHQLRQGSREGTMRRFAELLQSGGELYAHPDTADGSLQYLLIRGARELYEAGRIGEPDYTEACRLAKQLLRTAGWGEKRRIVSDFFESRLDDPAQERALEARHAVEQAKAFIDAHFAEAINLTDLAQKYYLSPGYFSSLFRQHTGRNFLEYVTHLRMEHAKALIAADPGRKIGEVAMQCGYQDLKYFRKLFKRYTGATPLKYKEDAGLARSLDS